MDKNNSGGMTLMSVVQIVLIILKIFDLIKISWWLVFAPTLFGLALLIIVIIVMVTIGVLSRK